MTRALEDGKPGNIFGVTHDTYLSIEARLDAGILLRNVWEAYVSRLSFNTTAYCWRCSDKPSAGESTHK